MVTLFSLACITLFYLPQIHSSLISWKTWK